MTYRELEVAWQGKKVEKLDARASARSFSRKVTMIECRLGKGGEKASLARGVLTVKEGPKCQRGSINVAGET